MHKVYLKPGKEDSLKRFHPWIFSGAIAHFDGEPEEGEVVEVYTSKKNLLPKESMRPDFRPDYFSFLIMGGYKTYDAAQNQRTLADLQVTEWLLSQFSTIDEVKAALSSVRVVGLEKTAVVHWRIGEPSGRQVVLEIVGGVPHFYENEVGVLTNLPV